MPVITGTVLGAAELIPAAAGVVEWIAGAVLSGFTVLAVGAAVILFIQFVAAPRDICG